MKVARLVPRVWSLLLTLCRRASDGLAYAFRALARRAAAGRRKLRLTTRLPRLSGRFGRLLPFIRNESLKLKLTIGSFVLAAVILGATYLTLARTSAFAAQQEAQQRAVDMSSFFSASIAESVAANDRMQVHVLAQALLNNGAHALLVTASDGAVLFASRSLPGITDHFFVPSPLPGSDKDGKEIIRTVHTDGNDYLQIEKPIRFGAATVGMIRLWVNQTELEESIRYSNAFIYPIFALGYLFMLLLSIAVLHTPFRELRKLTVVTERIGRGDLTDRVPVHGHDEVANFCRSFNAMVEGLSQARTIIQRRHLETIKAMIRTVEAKDSYTQGHCIRVQRYARQILGFVEYLSREEKYVIETAALLHDIGKIGIPDRILFKKKPLTRKEMEIVRSHVTIGESILLHIDTMKDVAVWVRHHHERWDGFGYPDGLRGIAIPFASRIITVADAIDAMLTSRPYRAALSPQDAIDALLEGKGQQFDEEIVGYAVTVLTEKAKERQRVLQV